MHILITSDLLVNFNNRSLFVDINDCAGDPCENGASCVDEVDGYRCDCVPGYEGNQCEISRSNTEIYLRTRVLKSRNKYT